MNISVRTLIFIVAGTLVGGLVLGWLFFSGSSETSDHQHIETSDHQIWTCSMHPQIRQNEPGQCPICGMDLIPLEEEKSTVDPMAVSMSPTAMQLASVVTTVIGKQTAEKSIRLNGKVQEDERLIYSQTTHVPGRIERLSVNFTGEYVAKGSPIAYLYSPQLVTAQQELFEAYKIKESQQALYRAARQKLLNWKLSERQIDQILESGEVKETFPVLADQSGYVVSKKVNLGDYVMKGQMLYEVANLSRVWVMFDVYESDLPWVSKGDEIEFTVSSIPENTFTGVIDYIDPIIDSKTRVAKARVVIENDGQRLKPEMFASGVLKAKLTRTKDELTVPKSAVMWTGKRSVVYVKQQTDQGTYFKMREVTLGPALGEAYLVKQGLTSGEEIAVNGTFSIDAAAQLAGKPSMMSPSAGGGAAMTGHNHGSMSQGNSTMDKAQMEHSQHEMKGSLEVNESHQTFESEPAFKKQLQQVFTAYLPVKDAMIAGDSKLVSTKSNELLSVIGKVDMSLVKGEAHMEWMKDMELLQASARQIAGSSDLKDERMLLSPLSDQLYYTLKKFNVEVNGYRQFCPMVMDNKGAYWLSDSEEILNPYFGEAMLTCGNVEDEL